MHVEYDLIIYASLDFIHVMGMNKLENFQNPLNLKENCIKNGPYTTILVQNSCR